MVRFLKQSFVILGMLGILPAHAQLIYKISPSSAVSISGTSTLSDWMVKSEKISGEMTLAPAGKNTKGSATPLGTIENTKVILEVSSIKSEKGEAMDNKMYRALKNDTHPQITFVLTRPLEVVNAPATLTATGDVTLAGVTRPMTFDLDFTREENTYRFQGSRTLKMSDFEIDPPSAMFGQIVAGDEIVVELTLFFQQ